MALKCGQHEYTTFEVEIFETFRAALCHESIEVQRIPECCQCHDSREDRAPEFFCEV